MAARRKQKDPDGGTESGWFTLVQMQQAFDLTGPSFAQSIRPLIPAEAVRNAGKRNEVRINCRAAIDAYAKHKTTQAVEAVKKETDPLLSGGSDSPALEEYRRHRAGLAELDLRERRNELAPLSKLWPTMERFAALVRRGGEALQRRFGADAAEIFNDAVDEAERVIKSQKVEGDDARG